MLRAWKPDKHVTITKFVVDRYLFQFHHKVDAARILDEGSWLYDNFHIVMDRIAPGVVPSFVPLNHINFWVQVHGLPLGFIQPKVGQGLGCFLGVVYSDIRKKCARSCLNWNLIMVFETKDPIPATMPRQNNTVDGASAARNTTNVGTETVPNFNDMMLVVQSHITTIKHDLLAAHNAAKAKQVVNHKMKLVLN
ncbi:DUF4283 domain protein [Medicago truncatula]|uniref:DUF4283 domain protein n=1 Tax=Medicago truncatula TaxID=3880 RepID=G7JLE2_MEDTR|nr:DUF4283 domain protein [Medicago truncatula]